MSKVKTTKQSCDECTAICCKNLAMEIGKPTDKKEVEDLKWQLQFDTVQVYIKSNRWYQLVEGRCIHLSEDERCNIYEKRPLKCRRHNPPNCELYDKFYDVMLSTPDDLDNYISEKKKAKRKR